jgi:Lrp/AsnC family transcriptional regulator for asnA, asnC and gidA
VDKLDSKIIEILQSDGRASNASIARNVGVSEGTVRRRLKRLIQDEFIKVVALPDPAKMGLHSEALVGIQVEPDKVERVADDLAGLKEVNWVAMTTGQYDIFAWVTLESAEALGIFLRTKVGSIPGVRRPETFVSLSTKRRG